MTLLSPLTGLAPFNLYTLAQKYVAGGLQPDSLRRFLNRRRISTAGLNLSGVWQEAVQEKAVSDMIVGRSPLLRPRPERDMVPKLFKEPFNYRYAVQIDYFDPNTRQVERTALSVLSNDQLTKGEAQRRALEVFNRVLGVEGRYGAVQGSFGESAELLNAYYNVGGAA